MSSIGEWLRFTGRVSRKEFWLSYFMLPLALTSAAGVVDNVAFRFPILYSICFLVCFVATIAGQAKRCHDRNRSAWWLLVGLTGIGALWLCVELGFLPGTAGANRFGAEPVDPHGAGAFSLTA